MRILVLTNLYPPHYKGGYELQCEQHATELLARGHEVFVLTSRWGIGGTAVEGNVYRLLHFDRLSLDSNIKERSFDRLRLFRRCLQLKWAICSRKNYAIASKMVAILKPDIAYVWNMGGVSPGPVMAVQDWQVPTVFRLDDYWLAELKAETCLQANSLKRWYRATIEGLHDFRRIDVSHTLFVSRWVKQMYLQVGFAVEKGMVIPNGVPLRMILDKIDASTAVKREDVRLVHVGRIDPEKGTHVAINALAHLIGEMGIKNVRLDVIGTGRGEYVRQLQQETVALGLERHVAFTGLLPHEEVLRRFAEYDAVLITSVWAEPLAGTIAQAMARGLPVITTDLGGSPEIVSDGQNGLLVSPGDPVKLAQAIGRLVGDATLAQTIRRNALATVREGYAHERIVDQVERYLEGVLLETGRTVTSERRALTCGSL